MSQRLSSPRKVSHDPLSQTVSISPLPTRSFPQKPPPNLNITNQNPSPVYAYLTPLTGENSDKTTPPYPITASETVIGKRSGAVQYLINDPSVDALHARLIRLENGRFRLYDNGSLYGTWVNYTPISQEGTNLEDGDLIHFGKVGFRFRIT
jgi:pSer/pThr/pTyr-binding forkhead associated (FHA) protein